jgi:hypothetical protein
VPKPKTKMGPIETPCTETAPGQWDFSTGTFSWRWFSSVGINLFSRMPPTEGYAGMIYAKDLNQAVMFAQGLEAGYAYALLTNPK